MLSKIARELLRRPVLLLSLSVAAILLGIAILLLARLPAHGSADALGNAIAGCIASDVHLGKSAYCGVLDGRLP